jgi:hypothetical protein
MTILLWLAVAVVIVVAVVWLGGFVLSRAVVRHNAARGESVLGAPGPQDIQESAAMLAPAKGFGLLRLTPDALLFAKGSTDEVTRFERRDIRSTVPSTDLGGAGGALKRPALVVTTASGEAMAIAVTNVDEWLERLNPDAR